jgi:hypothetical protein
MALEISSGYISALMVTITWHESEETGKIFK